MRLRTCESIFKTLVVALLASILTFGLSACGGSDQVDPAAGQTPGDQKDLAAIQTAIDTSYATQGQATIALDVQSGEVGPAVMQTDGKLLITGWRQTAPILTEWGGELLTNQVYVLRLNADGARDSSFGVDGEVRFNIKGRDTVADVKLQPDGRILLAVNSIEPCNPVFLGQCMTQNGQAIRISAIVRLTPQGMMDSAFSIDGMVLVTGFGGYPPLALAVQNDGTILLLRSTSIAQSRTFGWTLSRYTADGTLDMTFNHGNEVRSTCGGDGGSMVIRPDGRIVVGAGQDYWHADVKPGFCLERINSDGSLDEGFGVPNLWTALSANISLRSLSLLPGAKLLAIGYKDNRALAVRYDPDGRLDATFGVAGIVQLAIDKPLYISSTSHVVTSGGDLVIRATQSPDVVAGQAPTYQPTWFRLDAQGQPVSGFGLNGLPVGAPDALQLRSLLQDPQGHWFVINKVVLPDGMVAIVVTRLRGDSQ